MLDSCKNVGLSPSMFRMLLQRQFVGLVGSATSVPGSFGSLEVDKEQKAKFAASAQPGNGAVLSLEVSGTVSDGALLFIDNRQSSATFAATVRLHRMAHFAATTPKPIAAPRRPPAGADLLEYEQPSCRAYQTATRLADEALEIREAQIAIGADSLRWRGAIARDSAKLFLLDSLIAALPRGNAVRDTLLAERARVGAALVNAQRRTFPDSSALLTEAVAQWSAQVRAAQDLLKVTGYRLGWFTISAGIANTAFKLFDPAAAADAQVANRNVASPHLGISYSRFVLSTVSYKSRFWTVGVEGSIEENAAMLSKIELTDAKQHGTSPDERVSKKTYNALQGDYRRNLLAVSTSVDWNQFLFAANQAWAPPQTIQRGAACSRE